MEQLESRVVLNAAPPELTIGDGQFFVPGGDPAPFRATFTDKLEAVTQQFDYTINWGDGSETIGNTARFRTQLGPYGLLEPAPIVGNPIFGIIDEFHVYANTGPYTVKVTLFDGLGGSDMEKTQVYVYPVDDGIRIGGGGNESQAVEGTPFTLSLFGIGPQPQTVENIVSWTINWGDSIEVIPGNPSTATHVYADNDNLSAGDAEYQITVAVTGSNGTFFGFGTNFVSVADVFLVSSIGGATDVNEGATYTLNLSAFDPGDPVIGWLIGWGDELERDSVDDFTLVPGNPTSATHVYADGDADYTIFAFALTDTESVLRSQAVSVHNVAPTAHDATFELLENSPNGTPVGEVMASDPGLDALSFSIFSASVVGAFEINSSTGEITVLDSTLLDIETTPNLTLVIKVSDQDGADDTAVITINLVSQPSIHGFVFVDINENAQFDADEPGIDGVVVALLDQDGNAVLDSLDEAIIAVTSSGGYYLFEDLNSGTYQIFEHQPTGVDDGAELLGSLGGAIVGNDRMQLTLVHTDATDYAFAEVGQQVTSGDAAGAGFWQGKKGRELITQGGTQIASWLTLSFQNVFGNTFAGADGGDVADFFRDQLFRQKGKKSAGPAKVDAEFMAVALATFFTSRTLAGEVAASYGFNVTDTGIGTKVINVGTNGAAFSVDDGTDLTILQLLLATDRLTDQPDNEKGFADLYDTDGDGAISTSEGSLRSLAFNVYSAINETGGI